MTLERRAALRRTRLRRKPRPSRTDRDLALAWYREVTYRAVCAMCGRDKGSCRMQAHHPIRQQAIDRAYPHGALWDADARCWRPAQWPEEATRTAEHVRWDPSNGLPLCPGCHERHTNRSRRVPFERLGDGPRYFALVHRDRFGTNFEIELEREHPRAESNLRPLGGINAA